MASMCLLLFSMSFVHFGSGHPLHAWSSEVALHHGGIPLALFILMQDYRFVLLDAFMRFLPTRCWPRLSPSPLSRLPSRCTLWRRWTRSGSHPDAGHLHTSDPVRDAPQSGSALVDRCGLPASQSGELCCRRSVRDRNGGEKRNSSPGPRTGSQSFMKAERSLLDCRAPARRFLREPGYLFSGAGLRRTRLKNHESYRWAEAIVPLRFSFGEVTYILLGRRKGGRRYLSEDLRVLGRLATAITEQVERYRDSEMQKLMVQAELRALQSQINPHFLFNALNTLFGIIPREASGARRTVLNLADIFRYSLQTPEKLISLSEEMEIVRAYLEIEKLRLGARLQVEIDIDDACQGYQDPGACRFSRWWRMRSSMESRRARQPGWVRITAKADAGSSGSPCRTAAAARQRITAGKVRPGLGLGLANVSKRLQLCYGAESDLTFEPGPQETTVQFSIPIRLAEFAVR